MGLFSRKKKETVYPEIEFNKDKLNRNISKFQSRLFASRSSESHKDFVQFIESLRNLEILNLTTSKDLSSEAYHYHRGRVESLGDLLNIRQKFIEDLKYQKSKEAAKSSETQEKRSYTSRPRPTSAGLSI